MRSSRHFRSCTQPSRKRRPAKLKVKPPESRFKVRLRPCMLDKHQHIQKDGERTVHHFIKKLFDVKCPVIKIIKKKSKIFPFISLRHYFDIECRIIKIILKNQKSFISLRHYLT